MKMGKMTSREIAEWLGIAYGTYVHNKGKYLKELEGYCTYEEVYGGINVTSIFNMGAPYEKRGSEMKGLVQQHFEEEWDASGIDTGSNVANKIILKYGNDITIQDGTVYRYTLEARNELYGKPFMSVGKNGYCSYQWCKETDIDDSGIITLAPLTAAEEVIKKDLMQKYFSTDAEKEIIVAQMVDAGEISKAEAYDITRELKNLNGQGFMSFKKALEEAIGYRVVRGTVLFRDGEEKINLELDFKAAVGE